MRSQRLFLNAEKSMNTKRAQAVVTRVSPKRDAEQLLERASTLAQSRKRDARAEAMRLLLAASRMGSAEATYAIGTWYLYGRHVRKNLAEASRYFALAARKRHPSALFDLAVMHERGQGVRRNLKRAFTLYTRAAELGYFDALKSVVRCIYHGIGTVRAPELGALSSITAVSTTFHHLSLPISEDSLGALWATGASRASLDWFGLIAIVSAP